eukprot:1693692-Pyramimonas_sp.AAC.1
MSNSRKSVQYLTASFKRAFRMLEGGNANGLHWRRVGRGRGLLDQFCQAEVRTLAVLAFLASFGSECSDPPGKSSRPLLDPLKTPSRSPLDPL